MASCPEITKRTHIWNINLQDLQNARDKFGMESDGFKKSFGIDCSLGSKKHSQMTPAAKFKEMSLILVSLV